MRSIATSPIVTSYTMRPPPCDTSNTGALLPPFARVTLEVELTLRHFSVKTSRLRDDLHFRWLEIKAIHAGFPISIMLSSNHLN